MPCTQKTINISINEWILSQEKIFFKFNSDKQNTKFFNNLTSLLTLEITLTQLC